MRCARTGGVRVARRADRWSADDAHRLRGIDRRRDGQLRGGCGRYRQRHGSRRAGQRISPRDVGPDRARRERSRLDHDRARAGDRPRAQPAAAMGARARARHRGVRRRLPVGVEHAVHVRSARPTFGGRSTPTRPSSTSLLRPPREPLRSRRRPEDSESCSSTAPHRPRSSTTTATSCSTRLPRPRLRRRRSPACCTRMPSSRASSSPSAAREIFGWDGTTVTPGVSTSVAGDDIVLAEPRAEGERDRRRADLARPRHGHRKQFERLRSRHDRLGRRNPDAPAPSSPRPAGRWR